MNTAIHEVERAVAELAQRQHGLFTRAQARTAGASFDVIAARVRRGWWQERTRRVLAVSGAPRTPHADVMAAVLHVGPAAASHETAATLYRLPGFDVARLHVTGPGRHRTQSSATLHSHALPPSDVVVVDGIPATSVPRTLFDLAAVEHPRRVERALDNALAMRLATVEVLQRRLAEHGGRPGVRLMRRLLAARTADYVPPASELEARFLELVRQAGLPEPDRQVSVGGDDLAGRADMVWRRHGLIAELDSRRHHTARLDAAEDARRDVAAAQGGWRILRVTWEDVFGFPARTMSRLGAALSEAAMQRRAG